MKTSSSSPSSSPFIRGLCITLLFFHAESFNVKINSHANPNRPRTKQQHSFAVSSSSPKIISCFKGSSSSSSMSLQMSTNEQQQLSPKTLINRGMNTFRRGNVKESISFFDEAESSVPGGKALTPFLWQRGISYYYADMFEEGSKQFRIDVKVNPLDVEEIVWDIACQNRLSPDYTTPKESMMSLPKGKTDRRKIMSTVYSLFRGDGATEHDLAMAGHTGSPSDEFYSLFYLGLYCESKGEITKAEQYMKAAKNSAYATGYGSGDYMTDCARVHCQLRGWI